MNLHGEGNDSLLVSLARTAISQAVIEVGDSHAGRAISRFLEATPETSWPQLLEWVKETMPSPIQKSPVDQLSAWQAKCAAHLTQPNSAHSLQAAQKLAKDLRKVLFDGNLLYNTAVRDAYEPLLRDALWNAVGAMCRLASRRWRRDALSQGPKICSTPLSS